MIGWLVRASPAAVERWRTFESHDELVAPSLVRAECATVLTREVHAGRISEADGRHQVAGMAELPIRLVEPPSLYTRAFDMARALGWGKAYDALYLATAELEGAELLTLDGGMGEAAGRLGVRCAVVRDEAPSRKSRERR